MPGGNVDTGEKWLGNASMLQSMSTDVKGVTRAKGRCLRKSHGVNIIQQLREKNFVQRPSVQQDVDTVRDRAQPQSMGGNTHNSSLQQEVQVPITGYFKNFSRLKLSRGSWLLLPRYATA